MPKKLLNPLNKLDKLNHRIDAAHSLLCVGLDSDLAQLPERFRTQPQPQFAFNKWIIDQTHKTAIAYKPNMAFYEARGAQGITELALTMEYLRQRHPDILTICDAKRADIGSTNQGYVTALFDQLGFDAVTLNPYLGREAMQPFLDRTDKISIILCKTSNLGAGELQDLEVSSDRGQQKLWQVVARKVSEEWNQHGNCMLVVGATYPDELKTVRQMVGDMTLLVPGVGTQGGELSAVLTAGLTPTKKGLIINVSRGIIFAKKPGEAAKQLQADMQLTD